MSDFLPPVTAVLRAEIGQFTAKMGEARGEMARTETEGSGHFSRLSKMGTTALLGIAGAAIGLGAESVHLADTFETSHARLETAVHNSGASWASWSSQVADADKQLEAFGFTNADTENSLARLVPVTHGVTQATGLMTLAADIAHARHMSLEAATQKLVMAESGHVGSLGRLGINLHNLDGSMKTSQQVIEELAQMYRGSASAAADTLGGKEQALEARLSDLGVQVGGVLVPVLGTLVGGVDDVITFFEHGGTAADVLGIAVGTTLVAAFGLFTAIKVKGFLSNVVDLFGGSATAAGGAATATDTAAASMGTASAAEDVQAVSLGGLTAALEANTVALGGQTAAEQASATAASEAFAAYQTAGAGAVAASAEMDAAAAGAAGSTGIMGGSALAAAGAVGVLAGSVWLGMDALGQFNNDGLGLTHMRANELANDSLPQLSGKFSNITGTIDMVNSRLAAGQGVLKAYGITGVTSMDQAGLSTEKLDRAMAALGMNSAIGELGTKFQVLEGQVGAVAKVSPIMAEKLIAAAVAAGLPAGEIDKLSGIVEKYNEKLRGTPAFINTTAVLNVGQALGNLDVLSRAYANSPATIGQTIGFSGGNAPATDHYSPFGVFLGHYDQGGVVPGPVGAPGWAVVHGGERIETPAQQAGGGSGGGGGVVVNFQPIIVGELSTSQAKALARQLGDEIDNVLHGMHRQGRGGYPPS